MQVKERIAEHAQLLADSIVKVDSILNHQIQPDFIQAVAEEFEQLLPKAVLQDCSRIVTVEASGIAPAFALGQRLALPITYARKGRRITMAEPVYSEVVPSRTSDSVSEVVVSAEAIAQGDRVLFVDDFLGSGAAAAACASIIRRCGADLLACAFVIEKSYENGRQRLEHFECPIVSLAGVDIRQGELHFS